MIRYQLSQFARTLIGLLEPIGFLSLVLIALSVALWWRRQRGLALICVGLVLFIQVVGGTDLPGAMLRSMERPYAGVKFEELPTCDAVILLGGGFEPSRYEVGRLHLSPAADRGMLALELLRLGKAPVLCVGGGSVDFEGERWSEADLVRDAVTSRGLTTAEVISLGPRTDTHDEALGIRELARQRGWKRFLLVTSANHMRRAAATFQHLELDVIPAPCNFLTTVSTSPGPPGIGIPGWQGFAKISVWMHEQIGWLEYRRRGWID